MMLFMKHAVVQRSLTTDDVIVTNCEVTYDDKYGPIAQPYFKLLKAFPSPILEI